MSSTAKNKQTKPVSVVVTLFILMGFWGYAFVAIKSLLDHLTPVDLTILRFFFVFVSIVFFMLFELARGRYWPKLQRNQIPRFVFLGLVGVVAYHLALNIGEQFTTATVASIIVFTSPVFTLIIARLVLGEKITILKASGVALALAGALIIILSGGNGEVEGLKAIIGGIIVLISPISWALYTVFSRKFTREDSSISSLYYSIYSMLAGSIMLMVFIRPDTISSLLALPLSGWINLLILSVICSFAGYIIWVNALRYFEAGQLSAFLYLIPIFTGAFSQLILDEPITLTLIVGAILIFVGIYLAERG